MGLLAQLWLPIVLSAVGVFIASSLLHMVLKFWHGHDGKGFSNEDEVGAAIRKGNAGAGMYMIPFCKPEAMKDPAMQDKFKLGPIGTIFLRPPGMINMGSFLGQWFLFCLLVSFLCALLAVHVMAPGADHRRVFHVIGLAAFLGYGMGSLPNAIWWGHPWVHTIKHLVDGLIYAFITGLVFSWLWPA